MMCWVGGLHGRGINQTVALDKNRLGIIGRAFVSQSRSGYNLNC